MRRSRKLLGVACVVIGAAAVSAVAAEPATEHEQRREAKAKQVAAAWFDSLMRGDTAVTTSLSDVPFAWDGKQIIESIGELERLFESVVADKGKRNIRATGIKVVTEPNETEMKSFPVDCVVVDISIDDEDVSTCISPGDTFKVVGFRD